MKTQSDLQFSANRPCLSKAMTRTRRALLAALLTTLLMPLGALAQELSVEQAWVRGTVSGQKVTGAFMQLTASSDQKLVGVTSPVAGIVEIHEMKMENGVMKMRETQAILLPAGKKIELKPGGYHVMLMDLKQTLAEGQTVPLELTLESASGTRSKLSIQAQVRPLGQGSGAMMHKH